MLRLARVKEVGNLDYEDDLPKMNAQERWIESRRKSKVRAHDGREGVKPSHWPVVRCSRRGGVELDLAMLDDVLVEELECLESACGHYERVEVETSVGGGGGGGANHLMTESPKEMLHSNAWRSAPSCTRLPLTGRIEKRR